MMFIFNYLCCGEVYSCTVGGDFQDRFNFPIIHERRIQESWLYLRILLLIIPERVTLGDLRNSRGLRIVQKLYSNPSRRFNTDKLIVIPTWTNDRCIFIVTTVMYTPSIVWTSLNRTFIAQAVNIIQPYISTSLTEVSRVWSTGSIGIPKCTTNDSGIIHIPVIVTDCSPGAIVKYLHSPFSIPVSSNQSNGTWERKDCVKSRCQ